MFDQETEEMLREAIRIHGENVKFGEKLLKKFGHAVTPSGDILIQQMEIILGTRKKK